MPIYTYRCKDCDYQFEKRQRMADDPLTQCVDCEAGEVRRVVNSVGIVFKGSGFYVTDNRNGKGKAKLNGSSANGDSAKSSEVEASTNGSSKETAVSEKPSPKPKAEKTETAA